MFWFIALFLENILLRNRYKKISLAVFNAAKVAYIRTSSEIQSNEVVWKLKIQAAGLGIYIYTDFPEMMSAFVYIRTNWV